MEALTERFEENRHHLRAVAYRLLGSLTEAEDAVQEAWLRLQRTDVGGVHNLAGWLTTVVSHICLDMLRSRKSRREEPLETQAAAFNTGREPGADPEGEAILADSVGVALLVLLDTLTPPERLAFVLHDLFGMTFEEIGPIIDRTPEAARQVASRARRRVRGAGTTSETDKARQRVLVEAFIEAARTGDLRSLLAVLDPDAVLRIDGAARMQGGDKNAVNATRELKGALTWAKQLIARSRALRLAGYLRFYQLALIDGSVGIVVAPLGRLARVLIFSSNGDRITQIDVVAEAERLREMEIVPL